MMADELFARLSGYEEWKAQPPNGWLPMDRLDLLVKPVDYLLADGRKTRRPCTSNADWIVEGLKPIAWRPVDPPASGVDLAKLRSYAR